MPCLRVVSSAFTVFSGVKTHLKKQTVEYLFNCLYIMPVVCKSQAFFQKKIIIFRQIFNQEKTQRSGCTLLSKPVLRVVQCRFFHCIVRYKCLHRVLRKFLNITKEYAQR